MANFCPKVCILTALMAIVIGMLLLKSAIVTGSLPCSEYEFPCENGECVDAELWCDSYKDCSDGSDEKYCSKVVFFNTNPNRCSVTYFKCKDGPCIPAVGRCDGFNNCDDSSDEIACDVMLESSTSGILLSEATTATNYNKFEGTNAVLFFADSNVSQNSAQLEPFRDLGHSSFTEQRQMARNWLRSQRRSNFGWGHDTPRAILALYLSDVQDSMTNTPPDLLMIKQMEIQLAVDIERDKMEAMKVADLAIYINALLSSCKDPKDFYGNDLVQALRNGVSAAQKNSTFVNPYVYLTLCINNSTRDEDVKQLQEIFLSKNETISRIDIQSLALLTAVCMEKNTNLLNESLYEDIKKEFLQNLKVDGFPGNVHEAALLFQALKEMKVTLAGLTNFILKQQQADGSFGDTLSTYLVLPILAGKNILHMKDHCRQQNVSGITPIEMLQQSKAEKMQIQYSLIYGSPTEIKQTIQMPVPEGANVLDVMRLAQEINPKYKFKMSANRRETIVYSIGEMPNDAEKGMYWTFFKASKSSSDDDSSEHWVPYLNDIRHLVLEDGDKVLFQYRQI